MKAVTVVGTLAAVLALSACNRADDGTTAQGTGAAGTATEQRAGDSSGARVDTTRDASSGAATSGSMGGTGSSGATSSMGSSDTSSTSSTSTGSMSSTDASGSSATTTAPGTTVNAPPDAAPSVPGQQDAVVTGTPRPGDAAERAGEAMKNAGERAVDATARGVDTATDAVSDAAITASVNAELARDSELSALGINVDTDNARVTLRGTAPNQAAAERATGLAQKVRGVSGVNNELSVQGR